MPFKIPRSKKMGHISSGSAGKIGINITNNKAIDIYVATR